MNVLAIESASTVCGVALFLDNKLIEIDEIDKPRVHGERLPIVIDKMIKKHNLELSCLDAIAVSSGPGSYTGLRIGMSFAKGLAMAAKIPIIPVPTLEVMNHNIDNDGYYYIVLYSHKDLVFQQYFQKGNPISSISCEVFDSEKLNPRFGYNMNKIVKLSENELAPMSAKSVGELAINNFAKWKVRKLSEVSLNYVTDFKLGKT